MFQRSQNHLVILAWKQNKVRSAMRSEEQHVEIDHPNNAQIPTAGPYLPSPSYKPTPKNQHAKLTDTIIFIVQAG
jgi:hypothetical protein